MLGELVIFGTVCAGGALVAALKSRNDRRQRELLEVWRQTSQRLGFSLSEQEPLRMVGTMGALSIRIETGHDTPHGSPATAVTRFHLEDTSRVPLTFRMRRRSRSGWLLEDVERNGVVTGDPHLDELVLVRGNEVRLAAVMNQRTRELIKLAVGVHGASIGYGRITHRELEHVRNERRLIAVLHMLRDLGESLVISDEDIPRALYDNLSDPIDGVRRKNFQLLFEYFPDSPEAKKAMPIASSDPDPVVRLSAALGRGIDGLPELVEAIDDPYVGASIKVYAIRQLALRYRGSIVQHTLTKLLISEQTSVVRAALRAIAAAQKKEMVPEVLALLRQPQEEDVYVDAIAAIGALGDPSVEADLIEMLRHALLPVRISAAYALGTIGTLTSIEHLIGCSSGLFTHRALRETSRRAIRRIQERFGAAGAGLLSLVEGESRGELSMGPPDSEGALSFD